MIQQVNAVIWRVIYTFPFTEFLARKSMEVASEGRAVISYSVELNQVTVLHELGSFNRCRIAGRFYIEKYMEKSDDKKIMEYDSKRRETEGKESPL